MTRLDETIYDPTRAQTKTLNRLKKMGYKVTILKGRPDGSIEAEMPSKATDSTATVKLVIRINGDWQDIRKDRQ